jgi:hypothetical protein
MPAHVASVVLEPLESGGRKLERSGHQDLLSRGRRDRAKPPRRRIRDARPEPRRRHPLDEDPLRSARRAARSVRHGEAGHVDRATGVCPSSTSRRRIERWSRRFHPTTMPSPPAAARAGRGEATQPTREARPATLSPGEPLCRFPSSQLPPSPGHPTRRHFRCDRETRGDVGRGAEFRP